MKRILPLLFCLSLLAACTSKPVRHLASDAALIRPGATTAAEVRQYLGEPQEVREPAPGLQEYVYMEDVETFWGKVPVANRVAPGGGYETLSVILRGDVVENVVFRKFNEKDPDWVRKDDGE